MRFLRVLVAIAVLLIVISPVRAAGPVTTVLLRNPADQPVKNVPITFGQVFKKGDIKESVGVKAVGAVGQADVKRKHDDGSVRFAVISMVVPNLPAQGELVVELSNGAVTPPVRAVSPTGLFKTEFDATVRLSFPDGTKRSISARELIRDAAAGTKTWLSGPVCSEFLLNGPPVDKDGMADPDLNVQFQVRVYKGVRGVSVSAVVENCWDTWAGNIDYDVTVDTAGKTVYEKSGVNHGRLSRWRKVFWWPAEPATVEVIHDLEYMSACGALPHYDRTLPVGVPKQLPSGANFDIMGSGSLTRYMPTTGGRPEIGPYPQWAVRYLLTMSPTARQLVLANGDLAGSWPIHIRSRQTGRVMTIDDRPTFWIFGFRDNDGYERPHWQPDRGAPPPPQDAKGNWNILTPDVAHMGSFIHPDEFDPRMSAPYRMIIGETVPGGTPIFYQNWKKLAEENIKFGNKPELPTYGGSYSYSARMAVACAVDAEFPGADEALRVFETLLPDWHQQLTSDPTFAISPRKTGE